MKGSADIAVIGGGMIGAAIGYGLARRGVDVAVFDEGDVAFRAARGNFGLVWVQRKGADAPDYAAWTRRSANEWADFAAQLIDETGVDPQHQRKGGFELCLSEPEFDELDGIMQRLQAGSGGEFTYEMLCREELTKYLPALGPSVVGASYSPQDGCANPLYLLRALHAGLQKHGGRYLPRHRVKAISPSANSFAIECDVGSFSAERVVLTAGLANRELAPQVGLKADVRPVRGQILVTEKVRPFLEYPTLAVRQMHEGGCILGYSDEEVGFDEDTTSPVIGSIAHRAVSMFPFLENVQVVRAWAALRTMSSDGLPVYEQSQSYPGAFVATTHSGITLAAAHANELSEYIADGALPDYLSSFRAERFDVSTTAAS